MISFTTARKIVSRHLPRPKTRCLELIEAEGRFLSRHVAATADAPAFDRAIMDGFAVRSRDTADAPVILRVVGFIPAGKAWGRRISAGECVGIATGAMMPPGADVVIKNEDVRILAAGRLRVLRRVRKGEDVYPRGCDYRKGTLLLRRMTLLNPARIALLSSQGYRRVEVFAPPRVALLTTGDEIVACGRKLQRGQVHDATRPMILSGLARMGVLCEDLGHVCDSAVLLDKKVRQGLRHDILIVTGGVSAGERDYVPRILEKNGVRCLFHKVLIRPGKPLWFGQRRGQLVFGLPGNPIASLVTFMLFVKPAIECLQGAGGAPPFSQGILTKGVYNKSERLSFLPARIWRRKKQTGIVPVNFRGSADMYHVAGADCFFTAGPHAKLRKGAHVSFFKI
jgi:molybdopterin molybdotransferase